MPYPVPPPPPLLIQIAAPSETVAVPAPTTPTSFEPERQPETSTPPATEAASLGGAIERSSTPEPPAVSLTFTTRQAQLPAIPAAPESISESTPEPIEAEASPQASDPETAPSTAESESFELFEAPSVTPSEPPSETPSEPGREDAPPPAERPSIETIQIDPTEENPQGQTLEIIPEPAAPDSPQPQPMPTPETPPADSQTPDPQTDPSGTGNIVELDADYQEFDTIREVFTGVGNVEMRFRGAVLNADRVQVNLVNRIAVAEGSVRLERGDQVLRGDRLTYNFVQTQGTVLAARGEVFIPSAGSDFSAGGEPVDPTTIDPNAPVDPANQPIFGTGGGLTFGLGSDNAAAGGTINRIRFEAERLEFTADGWQATNVRLTNDPFSPPELELRSPTVTFTRLSPTRSEIRARNPRIVFDQGFSLPLFRDRIILDERQREAFPILFGFDERDRGGFFIEGIFEPLSTPTVQLQLRPQIFLQQALFGGDDRVTATRESSSFFDNLGLAAQLNVRLSPTTSAEANLAIVSPLTFDNRNDNIRASLRARQLIGRNTLSLEYSFRDRLFNGSLGFQTVYSSLGFVFASPQFVLGNTGINYRYQLGAQIVTADTDRADLLEPIRDNNRVTLGRFQGLVEANRFITLWQGQPLPPTPTEGLRYTPNPVVPFVALVPSARLVGSFYTNGESQTLLTGTLGLFGQFGHYSRPVLDYTAFNVSYSQRFGEGESPFLFDRDADERVLSFGIRQQIYGPFLFGVQASINLDRGDGFDTDYSLEYNRRTYSIVLRVNPEREIASIGLRINEFNFGTDRPPFSGEGNTVIGGAEQSND